MACKCLVYNLYTLLEVREEEQGYSSQQDAIWAQGTSRLGQKVLKMTLLFFFNCVTKTVNKSLRDRMIACFKPTRGSTNHKNCFSAYQKTFFYLTHQTTQRQILTLNLFKGTTLRSFSVQTEICERQTCFYCRSQISRSQTQKAFCQVEQ